MQQGNQNVEMRLNPRFKNRPQQVRHRREMLGVSIFGRSEGQKSKNLLNSDARNWKKIRSPHHLQKICQPKSSVGIQTSEKGGIYRAIPE